MPEAKIVHLVSSTNGRCDLCGVSVAHPLPANEFWLRGGLRQYRSIEIQGHRLCREAGPDEVLAPQDADAAR